MESIKCQIGEILRNLLTLLILTASSVLWAAGSAIITLEMPVGARQLGMGEVGAAIADDATALYYNPAGLAFGPLADEWRMSYPEKSEKSPFFTKIEFFQEIFDPAPRRSITLRCPGVISSSPIGGLSHQRREAIPADCPSPQLGQFRLY